MPFSGRALPKVPFYAKKATCAKRGPFLHSIVGRAAAALGHDPVDVLTGVLNVARLAMDAVLGVDLQTLTLSRLQRDEFVHPWWQMKEQSKKFQWLEFG